MLMEVPSRADLHATRVLSLDAAGRILDWISWQEAVCLYVRDAVAWTLGDPCLTVHGGHNRLLGAQSLLRLHPIIASTGHCREHAIDPAPALTNTALFTHRWGGSVIAVTGGASRRAQIAPHGQRLVVHAGAVRGELI